LAPNNSKQESDSPEFWGVKKGTPCQQQQVAQPSQRDRTAG